MNVDLGAAGLIGAGGDVFAVGRDPDPSACVAGPAEEVSRTIVGRRGNRKQVAAADCGEHKPIVGIEDGESQPLSVGRQLYLIGGCQGGRTSGAIGGDGDDDRAGLAGGRVRDEIPFGRPRGQRIVGLDLAVSEFLLGAIAKVGQPEMVGLQGLGGGVGDARSVRREGGKCQVFIAGDLDGIHALTVHPGEFFAGGGVGGVDEGFVRDGRVGGVGSDEFGSPRELPA